jgi:hypothetical protein
MPKVTSGSTAWGSPHRQRVDRLVHGKPRGRVKCCSYQTLQNRRTRGAFLSPNKTTLDHFVMVRIHARQPSSPRPDLRAICDLQKLNTKTAVIWSLSGFEVLLGSLVRYVRITARRSLTVGLRFGQRTVTDKMEVFDKVVGIWYLRLRHREQTANPIDGVVKIERLALTAKEREDGLETSIVNTLSRQFCVNIM